MTLRDVLRRVRNDPRYVEKLFEGEPVKTVWKFPLEIADVNVISMPKGAEILRFDVQMSVLNLWALCDPNTEYEERRFYMLGTGHETELPVSKASYIGSCQRGVLVWHLFEPAARLLTPDDTAPLR